MSLEPFLLGDANASQFIPATVRFAAHQMSLV